MKNHFELFGLAPAFAVDLGKLEQAYKEIQSRVHPDKFAHAGDAERRASMQMTTQVNEAYQVLRSPARRARYLLELNGVDPAFETDTAMPKDFLMRQMEFRERLEEAKDRRALDLVLEGLHRDKKTLVQQLQAQLDSSDFVGAKTLVRELMFFDRLEDEVEAAYEALEA